MQTRAVRIGVLVVLLAAGGAAAFLVADTERRIQEIESQRAALERVVDRLALAVAGVTAAQQAYAEYGRRNADAVAHAADLLDGITTGAAGLRPRSTSADAGMHLEEFWAALSASRSAAAGARTRMQAGEAFAAADVLFGATGPQIAALEPSLRAFRDGELEAMRAERAALTERSWMTMGGAALVWLAGLVLLVRVPAPRAGAAIAAPVETEAPADAAAPVAPDEPGPVLPPVDLAATADLCATISRLTDTAALPGVLERAAGILDAHGLIVWMGAGDELFAATAAGYDPSVVGRLRPINRSAGNATAAAWRTGEIRVVEGDMIGFGAIVAPMHGAAGCIGVLAAEVRNGRESDEATRAVTGIIASQLAAVLSAWPQASTGAGEAAAPEAPSAAAGTESDRKAAAS